MANTSRLSVFISSFLDSIGFSRHMLDFRIYNTRYNDIASVLNHKIVGYILTGGTAEGTSVRGQGDIDNMVVYKTITVTGRHVDPPNPQHTVFYTEDMGVHPGYTWLRAGHLGETDNVIKQSLVLMTTGRVLKASKCSATPKLSHSANQEIQKCDVHAYYGFTQSGTEYSAFNLYSISERKKQKCKDY